MEECMKRPLILALAIATFAATAAFSQSITLNAVLTSAQETPPNSSPGYGVGSATLDATHTSLTVNLFFTKLTGAVTGAHIHGPAGPGVPANVVINFNPATNLNGNQLSATFTIPSTRGDQIYANPTNYYMNVHTAQNAGGEIRGQLAASTGTVYYAGDLRGGNETPPNSSTAVGAYFLSLDPTNTLTYEINIGSLANPTAAHIHTGAAGVAGPVLIPFATSAST